MTNFLINSTIENTLKQEYKSVSNALTKDFKTRFEKQINDEFKTEFNRNFEKELDKQLDIITDKLLENRGLDIFKLDKELEKVFAKKNPEQEAEKKVNKEKIINEIVKNYILKYKNLKKG